MLGRRWSRSSRLYLVGSLLLALMAGALLHGYLTRLAAAAGAAGPPVTEVVAAAHVARGTTLSAELVRVMNVPRAFAQPGSFSNVSQVSGRVALVDLSEGEAVTQTRLARVRAGPVASLIPEGLRAFAVPTSLPAGALVAGDRVDVLATFNTGQPHTETVVEGVEVLYVLGAPTEGTSGTAPGAGGAGLDAAAAGAFSQITLIVLVAPEQEGRLAFARAFANLEVTIQPAGPSVEPAVTRY